MLRKLKTIFENHYLPRWIVMVFDISIVELLFCVTFIIFNSNGIDVPFNLILIKSGLTMPLFLSGWLIFNPHQGIIRYFSISDIIRFFYAHLVGTSGFLLISYLASELKYLFFYFIPFPVIFAHFFVSLSVVIFIRISIQYVYHQATLHTEYFQRILIYGTGSIAITTKNAILQDVNNKYNIIGFIDDNPLIKGRKIEGLPVFSENKVFTKVLKESLVSEVIIACEQIGFTKDKKQKIVDKCIENRIKIREVPKVSQWLNGALNSTQIKEINIEDLLGREPILLEKEKIEIELNKKRILITGAAGSIGSEIVRQILNFEPSTLILVDRAESPLFDLQNEFKTLIKPIEIIYAIGDTTNPIRMQKIFETYTPEIIYHASAYKHVPLMEDNPYEAIRNNILSLKIVADLAVKYNTQKFVMISTDKAVNPTNVMGASKRICEMYVQALSLHNRNKTAFITTRFGNVLGSNGSVIPLFKNQIKNGGPVTVTNKEMIRYFMTIPEASQLVIEAGFMGRGGEIFIFDMGQPIKIFDLAEKMISLSGLIPNSDIKIEEIGLRPGEKLYEELLNVKENTLPTYNERILIGKTNPYEYNIVNLKITELIENLPIENDEMLVSRMKDIVSEYISNNSKFEILDKRNDCPD